MSPDPVFDDPWDCLALGTKGTGRLAVCRLGSGDELTLPVLVARGVVDGPKLLLLAGVHGDEYEGPPALWDEFARLDPAALRGTVVMAPVVNPLAYAAGSRVDPADPKDLARVFPGSTDGSTTERIAHVVRHRLIPGADLMCDFHSAGRFYRIDPWVGYGLTPDAEVLARQRRAAEVVGYRWVWGTPSLPGRSLSAAAECGVPALYVEAPGQGRADPEDVQRNRTAIRQMLRLLVMVDEPLQPLRPESVIEDDQPDAGHLQVQMVAHHGGFFRPEVQLGSRTETGAPFGRVVDAHGRTIETIAVPRSGRVVFLRTFPGVAPGDALGTVVEMDGRT